MTKTAMRVLIGTVLGVLGLASPAGAASCSDASLSGAYAMQLNGRLGRVVVAALGQLVADGNGGFTGSFNTAKNGFIKQSLSLTGSYTVNGDCTGFMTLNVTGFAAQHFQIVLSGGGTGFFGLQTDGGTVVSLTAKQ